MATERWLVRIRQPGGPVLGAGVLLSADLVLTCAHVVGEPDASLMVELAGAGAMADAVPARVAEDGWVPHREGDGLWGPVGDVALLRLRWPQPAERATTLHRLPPTRRRAVRLYGFPVDADRGFELDGRLGGRGGDGRVQIKPEPPEANAVEGFSGGAVVDDETDRVIGIVVSRYRLGALRASFMIPTGTVLHYLPQIRHFVPSESVIDRGFASDRALRRDSGNEHAEEKEDEGLALSLTDFLSGGEAAPPAASVVVGPDDDTRELPLWLAVNAASGELSAHDRAALLADAPPGTVPPIGSLDLAISVTGRTRAEVAERVCGRMGFVPAPGDTFEARLRGNPLPLTLAVRGVDRAREPAGVGELLGLLAEQGCRTLLVFDEDDEPARRAATAALEFRFRLGAADRLLNDCLALGRHDLPARTRRVTARAQPARGALDRAGKSFAAASALKHRIAALRTQGPPPPGRSMDEIEEVVATATTAIADLSAAIGHLDALVARRNELRGRLEAAHAPARGRDSASRAALDLSDRYCEARDLLWHAPCDVPAAEAAIRRYLDALHGRDSDGRDSHGKDSDGRDRP
ncbi:S1 family peptidase [Streptomyces sp. SBT349]|uniref:S1 family peptidase n=1 Tax=Streptomyces sp. SBT349 TaxID=1580539 RepID=UPI00131ECB73|nr:serine protease [Streptomyces sp. SBT349]